jgi:hypothetical protein
MHKDQILYDFKELDYKNILAQFNGNIKLYDKILLKYIQQYNTIIDLIDDMSMEQQKDFFHKYKSVTGTIGAKNLYILV